MPHLGHVRTAITLLADWRCFFEAPQAQQPSRFYKIMCLASPLADIALPIVEGILNCARPPVGR